MKNLKLALLVGLALCGFGCKPNIPAENTSDYNMLHGIINDGKAVNEITLINDVNKNHPKLRFPPGVFVNVITPGAHDDEPTKIRKGYAYSADVHLELPEKIKEQSGRKIVGVSVTFHAISGKEDAQTVEARLREIERASIRTKERVEWGLREYVLVAPKTDMVTQYEYVPADENFRSIDGVRMWFGCLASGSASEIKESSDSNGAYLCGSHFSYYSGLAVSYTFAPNLLPYWREIHREVMNFASMVVIKE